MLSKTIDRCGQNVGIVVNMFSDCCEKQSTFRTDSNVSPYCHARSNNIETLLWILTQKDQEENISAEEYE